MSNPAATIQQIHETVRFLQTNSQSQDINTICVKLNELAINSLWLAEEVSNAYAAMNNAEEAYKSGVAHDIANATIAVNKAERQAESAHSATKKTFIEYKNLHNKLKSLVERVDRVLDHYKQYVSLVKHMELKHI